MKSLAVDLDNPDAVALKQAADVIRSGGLIVYPTETLYGIGADATNAAAVQKVHEAKQRTVAKPILVIVDSQDMLVPLVGTIGTSAHRLMEAFWPGPLTLVFEASALVPEHLTRGTGTIGARMPSSKLCLHLLAETKVPLTSTSANISGRAPEQTIEQMLQKLTGIDLFLDAGELPESQPSTVVDTTTDIPTVLRNGCISPAALKEAVPDIQFRITSL